ncbi:uncharacterized protein LOC107791634 [Nicotiana tabacum]|uniref:Uncharacterized protein LOC107791634 n=2 Tax=Nicotiana TaxID=4085 RepID=A0A1S3ZXN9_TOBAC|nr:PREDICTED: uncharacterized protein LOC104212968 [Nicotiana sylvestris]XP_016469215.1 PREDICTED: uncharacterized protein LOC107791634 [Nicotiana tabacum]
MTEPPFFILLCALHITSYCYGAMEEGDDKNKAIIPYNSTFSCMTMNTIQDDIKTLSLFPQFSDNSVIKAEPIDYAYPHESSSTNSTTASNFSCISTFDDNHYDTKLPTLSLFPQNQAASKPRTLSLFPEFSENLATASKHFVNNYPPSSTSSPLPSTDLCLSVPGTIPETSTLPSNSNSPNIINQDSCASKRLFHQPNIGPVLKRKGEDRKLVPIKKRRLLLRPVAPAAAAAVEEEHWIIKKLTKSDVNGSSRLLLPRQEVTTYVIPYLDEQKATDCQKLCGTDVNVWDLDTQSEYSLTLKKWATDSFQLIKSWTPYFVKRRNLKEDDVIALRWDRNNSRFCFRVRSRHDHQVDNE